MTGRRHFLKAALSAGPLGSKATAAQPSQSVLREARAQVRTGALGRISFCRIAHSGLAAPAKYVLDEESCNCVIDVDPATQATVFLGTRATLVVTSQGFRLFGVNARSAT